MKKIPEKIRFVGQTYTNDQINLEKVASVLNEFIDYAEERDTKKVCGGCNDSLCPCHSKPYEVTKENGEIDLGIGTTCTICDKRFCTCSARNVDGSWAQNGGQKKCELHGYQCGFTTQFCTNNKSLQSRLNSAYQKGQENGKEQGRKEEKERIVKIIKNGKLNVTYSGHDLVDANYLLDQFK